MDERAKRRRRRAKATAWAAGIATAAIYGLGSLDWVIEGLQYLAR